MSGDNSKNESQEIVPESELHQFVVRLVVKVGAREAHADALANLLVSADVRGHYSHGLNRIDYYLSDIVDGNTKVEKEPEILKQTPATGLVEGNNCLERHKFELTEHDRLFDPKIHQDLCLFKLLQLGPVVGMFCMDLAIEKAKNVGIGWVCAKGSNHFGIAGWYSIRAMKQGLVGMAFTNTSPQMFVTRSKEKVLGTNPISLAASGINSDEFVLDMATTAVAQGKIEMKRRLNEPVQSGWGFDRNGKQTNDAEAIMQGGGLCPLGSSEKTSGYKGYGLAMMVELFCGIFSGGAFGKDIRKWDNHNSIADLGQCFVAIDPSAFAPGFEGRLSQLIHQCKSSKLADGEEEILVPGESEKSHEKLCDQLGGIPYHKKQVDYADELAVKYGVQPMKRL